jgi:hypothetical protein
MNCVCGKKFKSIKPYQKHRVLCEAKMFHYKKDITDNEPRNENIPDNNELWKIVRALMERVDKQGETIKQMKQNIYKGNKNIDVISILNARFSPRHDYKTFIENIIFSHEDLVILFKTNLIKGITDIIIAKFSESSIKTRPIQYFKERGSNIYVYIIGKWREINIQSGIKIIETIYNNLLKYYNIYNKNCVDDTRDNKFEELNKLIISREDKIKIYKKIHFNIKKEFNLFARNKDSL